MRLFTVPAAYRRHIEAAVAMAVADVGKDVERRSDEDVRIQRMAPVNDAFIDTTADGTLLIMVGVSNDEPTGTPQ
jgi:hypothetical protein